MSRSPPFTDELLATVKLVCSNAEVLYPLHPLLILNFPTPVSNTSAGSFPSHSTVTLSMEGEKYIHSLFINCTHTVLVNFAILVSQLLGILSFDCSSLM